MEGSDAILEKLKRLPPAQQAAVLEQLRAKGKPGRIVARDGFGPAPASYGQLGLWNVYETEGQSDKYNMPSAYRLTGEIDRAALCRSFELVVSRQASLRTRFRLVDGELYQETADPEEFAVDLVDLSDMSADDRKEEALGLIARNAQHRFVLEAGPLFKVSLVRLDADSHLLLLNAHHIIFDGWSKGILLKEVLFYYRQITAGEPLGEPDALPIQYTDFARWEREKKDTHERVLRRAQQIEGASHYLDVGDKARKGAPSGDGFAVPLRIDATLTRRLLECGRRQGASPFMTLLAAYAIALARYSGQQDMLIGTPVDCRAFDECRNLIGYFLNTLPIRVDVDERRTFSEILELTRRACTEAYACKDVPFHRLVEEVNPQRSPGITPLFQAMFVLQVAGANRLELPGVEIEQVASEKTDIGRLESASASSAEVDGDAPLTFFPGRTKYDVYLTLLEGADDRGLEGWLTYDADIFTQDTIRRWLIDYVALLEDVSSRPDVPLHALNRGARPAGLERSPKRIVRTTISEELERQARETPNAVALVQGRTTLTYSDLDGLANGIAHRLADAGVRAGDVVCLGLERSPELIACMLAAFKLGAAYLPVDPGLPDRRIEQYLAAARPRVVVTSAADEARFRCEAGRKASIERLIEAVRAREHWENPSLPGAPDRLAYLLYTSGTTGTPKAVMATHRATLNRVFWMLDTYPVRPGDVWCHKTTCSFVDAVAEVWTPLLSGCPLVIVGKGQVMDPFELVRLLREHEVSSLTVVPSLLSTLLDCHPDLGDTLPALHTVFSSGEALPAELGTKFHAAVPDGRLINLYGSTEVAGDVACHEVSPAAAGPGVPIGRPLDGCRLHVLDRYLNPCPPGVTGELFVGGAHVALGYHDDPSLTACSFVPDPSSNGATMFRTRDRVRLRHDGELEYIGRRDHQIKVRGFRINLDEIRMSLLEHEAVKDAAVGTWSGAGPEMEIVAYVVPEDESLHSFDARDARRFLSERLPSYMLPAHYVVLDELPLSFNGKIDRSRLPPPGPREAASTEPAAPETATERALLAIWQEVLGAAEGGIDDDFFDLGGHSLSAARIVMAVWEKLGVEILVQDIFTVSTVRALARHIDEIGGPGAGDLPAYDDRAARLSRAQAAENT